MSRGHDGSALQQREDRDAGPAHRPGTGVVSPRRARQVLALAGGAFREAVRMKAFAAGAIFAATAVAMSPFLPSDGTPAGAVRLSISVSLLAASVFGTLAAVMLASLLPARESRDRTGYLLATKPVPRWGLFAGRALGVSAVLAAMFVAMAILSWMFVTYTAARESGRGEAAAREVAEALTVRTGLKPAWETGPERRARAGPKGPRELPAGGRLRWRFAVYSGRSRPPPLSGRIYFDSRTPAALADVGGRLKVRAFNPGTRKWTEVAILGPPPLDAGPFLRLLVPAGSVHFDRRDRGIPGFVDIEVENTGARPVGLGGPVPVTLLVGSQMGIPPGGMYRWEFLLRPGTPEATFQLHAYRASFTAQEVQIAFLGTGAPDSVVRSVELDARGRAMVAVPAGLVGADGRVTAVMRNASDDGVRVVAGEGLVFAPRAGTFAGALARWTVLEIAKAALIAVVVCAGATVLSFPIPALLGGVIAAGGYLVSFIIALTVSDVDSIPAHVFAWALRIVLPDLAGSTASGLVAAGALVPMGLVLWSVLLLVVVRGGIIAALGAYLAERREVGA